VFRFSFYCLHVLCYSHCILTSCVCRDLFYTLNNNNNNNRSTVKISCSKPTSQDDVRLIWYHVIQANGDYSCSRMPFTHLLSRDLNLDHLMTSWSMCWQQSLVASLLGCQGLDSDRQWYLELDWLEITRTMKSVIWNSEVWTPKDVDVRLSLIIIEWFPTNQALNNMIISTLALKLTGLFDIRKKLCTRRRAAWRAVSVNILSTAAAAQLWEQVVQQVQNKSK